MLHHRDHVEQAQRRLAERHRVSGELLTDHRAAARAECLDAVGADLARQPAAMPLNVSRRSDFERAALPSSVPPIACADLARLLDNREIVLRGADLLEDLAGRVGVLVVLRAHARRPAGQILAVFLDERLRRLDVVLASPSAARPASRWSSWLVRAFRDPAPAQRAAQCVWGSRERADWIPLALGPVGVGEIGLTAARRPPNDGLTPITTTLEQEHAQRMPAGQRAPTIAGRCAAR